MWGFFSSFVSWRAPKFLGTRYQRTYGPLKKWNCSNMSGLDLRALLTVLHCIYAPETWFSWLWEESFGTGFASLRLYRVLFCTIIQQNVYNTENTKLLAEDRGHSELINERAPFKLTVLEPHIHGEDEWRGHTQFNLSTTSFGFCLFQAFLRENSLEISYSSTRHCRTGSCGWLSVEVFSAKDRKGIDTVCTGVTSRGKYLPQEYFPSLYETAPRHLSIHPLILLLKESQNSICRNNSTNNPSALPDNRANVPTTGTIIFCQRQQLWTWLLWFYFEPWL